MASEQVLALGLDTRALHKMASEPVSDSQVLRKMALAQVLGLVWAPVLALALDSRGLHKMVLVPVSDSQDLRSLEWDQVFDSQGLRKMVLGILY